MKVHGLLAAAALLVGASAPASAQAPSPAGAFKRVETWGWSAELPASWEETLKIKRDPHRLYAGKWGYHSPRKNFRVRVKVRLSEGLSWKERTKRTWEKLFKRFPEFKLLRSRSTQLNGRETFYLFGTTRLKRRIREHDYLIFRMLVRFPKRKLRVVMTFLSHHEREEDFQKVIDHFMETFALVEPGSADQAFEELRRNGMGAE